MIQWGETYLGCVTGNNSYFSLTAAEVAEHGLISSELIKISPPGSRHLRGLTFTDRAWQQMARKGGRCYLFSPDSKQLSAAALAYIKSGEKNKIQKAYKCTKRSPWWRVPQVPIPDILFAYMNHDCPRLTSNEAGVQILNSLYGIKLKDEIKEVGKSFLPIACLNSVTLLGSEVVGRAYGGGLLKHEPREVDSLPVPSPAAIGKVAGELKLLRPQLATALRTGNLAQAVKLVDEVIFGKHIQAGEQTLLDLRKAREILFNRRLSRATGGRGKDR
jgi:hypothetical protein